MALREIIFRGKRLDNGEWVEGGYFFHYGECRIVAEGTVSDYIIHYPVDPATVGQFTGLLDKNGKRIFEGDIAKIKGQGVYLCVWSKGNLEFSLTNVKESFGMAYLPMYNATVIGTIHDNPELLEVTPNE